MFTQIAWRAARKAANCFVAISVLAFGTLCAQPTSADEVFRHESFETTESFTQNWSKSWGGGTADVHSGDLVLHSNLAKSPPWGATLWELNQTDGTRLNYRKEWSFRALMTPELDPVDGTLVLIAIGTSDLRHAGIFREQLRAGQGESEDNRTTEIPYDIIGTNVFLQVDAFGREVKASVWRPDVPNSLVSIAAEFDSTPSRPAIALNTGLVSLHDVWISSRPIPFVEGDFDFDLTLDADDIVQISHAPQDDLYFDLNDDHIVDFEDHQKWVHELRKTWYGDASLDGEFSSLDLVHVFQAGKYENDLAAIWSEGDWDSDHRFTSGDFVIAFQDGGYERGPRASLAAVPEPTAIGLLLWSILFLAAGWHWR